VALPQELADTYFGELNCDTEVDFAQHEVKTGVARRFGQALGCDPQARWIPDAFDRLNKRHNTFRDLLQTNLTVIATAHAVSEGIIRDVSGELSRKQAPSTYGANGRAQAPTAKITQLSRLAVRFS